MSILPTNPEAQRRRVERLYPTVAAISALAITAFALNSSERIAQPHGPWDEAAPIAPTDGIMLLEGANVRTTPQVLENGIDKSNLLATVEERTFVSIHDGGVRAWDDGTNGTWWGIDRKDIVAASSDTDLEEALEPDDDDIVWVHRGDGGGGVFVYADTSSDIIPTHRP